MRRYGNAQAQTNGSTVRLIRRTLNIERLERKWQGKRKAINKPSPKLSKVVASGQMEMDL